MADVQPFDYKQSAVMHRRWILQHISDQGLREMAMDKFNVLIESLTHFELVEFILSKEFPNHEKPKEAHTRD